MSEKPQPCRHKRPFCLECHGSEFQGGVSVKRTAIEYLKRNHPSACERAGLCETIGGRQYTVTLSCHGYVLAAAYEALQAECEKLRDILADKVIDSTKLRGMVIKDGSITVGLEGGACALMAQSFGKQLFESGAENYIEVTFDSPDYPELGQITVTVKRESGKTPHQLRIAADSECEKLRKLLAETVEDRDGAEYSLGLDLVERIDAAIQEENPCQT